ncbi:MAG TPA: glycoside hydrolase family 16 protein [Caulobacterales bacterium]|jgi:beta-glucanase (GH16 family)|nr:glycoside hydrolase family 16 protein [Caulobacterales bacterium]
MLVTMAHLAVKAAAAALIGAGAAAAVWSLPRAAVDAKPTASAVRVAAPGGSTAATAEPVAAPAENWKLVWQEEFNGHTLDPKWWNIEKTTPTNPGMGDNDYTPEHVSVGDGMLTIKATKKEDGRYLTGLVETRYKGFWKYGRFEARMKVPPGPGTNSSFWMMPNVKHFEKWPKSGEIDIAEQLGREPTMSHGTIHYPGELLHRDHGVYNKDETLTEKLSDGFHVYAVEWRNGSFEWFIDGKSFHKTAQPDMAKFPFNRPFFMILCLGVGGKWEGYPTAETPMPIVMQVDWVRVYQMDPKASKSATTDETKAG